MFDHISVETVNRDQRCVSLAGFQTRKQFAAPRHDMRNPGDETATLEGHENGVAERAGFDRKIEAFKIGKARDVPLFCFAGQHDRQSGKVIRRGRR